MDKLYKSDMLAIEFEASSREIGEHNKPLAAAGWELNMYKNDYLEFIFKCAHHAKQVGDNSIAFKLFLELDDWETIYECSEF